MHVVITPLQQYVTTNQKLTGKLGKENLEELIHTCQLHTVPISCGEGVQTRRRIAGLAS